MPEKIALFRRRFIPNELTYIGEDEIVSFDEETIKTKWKMLSPHELYSGGESTYFRKKNLKVSAFFDKAGKFALWYVDIVRELGREGLKVPTDCLLRRNTEDFLKNIEDFKGTVLVYEDLLLDIAVTPKGLIELLDLDEAIDAYENNLITKEMLHTAMYAANKHLSTLYKRFKNTKDFTGPEFIMPEGFLTHL